MKSFFATILAVMLVFFSGCTRSASDYISEIGNFFENKVFLINRQNSVDENEIINIDPENAETPTGQLSAYNKLNDNEKKLYSIITKAVENMELRLIDITKYSSDNTLCEVVISHRAVMCDHPDFFWMPKTITLLSVEEKNNTYACFKDYYSENDEIGFYGMTKTERDTLKLKIEAIKDNILNVANGLPTKFDKELYIHDYLCDHVAYDNDSANDLENATPNSTNICGALLEGKAICEGYAKAMQYLCLQAGIPCGVVYGEHEGVAHMWNIINPGDGNYYLDVTFDDSSKTSVLHTYFNLTKADIGKDHIFSEKFSSNKAYTVSDSFNFFNENCKNTELNYFQKKSAYITEDCEAAINLIVLANQEGKSSAELKNMTALSNIDAFYLLKHKSENIINLRNCYQYDGEDIIVVVW